MTQHLLVARFGRRAPAAPPGCGADPSAGRRPVGRPCGHRSALLGWILALAGVLALGACAALPPHLPREPSYSVVAGPDTALGRAARASLPPGSGSGTLPLPLSAHAMDARLSLIRRAERGVDLQYYLLANDSAGHALLRAAAEAARRGVRVRLLVDDLYTADTDELLAAFSGLPHVEIRLFNPFPSGRNFFLTRWLLSAFDFPRLNRRMHNKLLVVDGAWAVAGGRNIADEYFFASKGGNFLDFDLLVAGAGATDLARTFDLFWNSPRVYDLSALVRPRGTAEARAARFDVMTADAGAAFPPLAPRNVDLLGLPPVSAGLAAGRLNLLGGEISVHVDSPEKVTGISESGLDEHTVTAEVAREFARAQKEIVVTSPYFIPGRMGMDGLRAARARGVGIEVLTNSLASNDEPFASAAYGRYRLELLRMGVKIYEVDSGQLKMERSFREALRSSIGRSHTKLAVMDERRVFAGSMNMDLRSARLNTELGLIVDSPELADAVLQLAHLVRDLGSYRLQLDPSGQHVQWVGRFDGVLTVLDHEPDVGWGTRLQLWLLTPLISENLL